MQVVGVSYFRIKPKTETMQKIEKEIKVTLFVAFDGTEFETEAECQHYEGSAFGQLLQQLKECRLGHYLGSDGSECYFLVPHTRHDIFVLGQILKMGGNDKPCAQLCDHLTLLSVHLQCNTVVKAEVTNLEEYIMDMSNGQYIVVGTNKKPEVKC